MFAILRTVAAVLAVAALGGQASPVSRRDVIAPKITSPTAASVWPIGTTQTVTWDTSNFPPVSQITNIIGQVILGFEANNSLNLDFNNPLASGFNLTDGSVQITVPNVTPRDDYLIVLFGDSGNTSPAFSITRISAPSGPSSSTSATAAPSVTNPPSPPIIGSTITGGESITTDSLTGSATTEGADSTTPTAASSSAPATTPTAPSATSGASSSTAGTGSGTALGASATTSAARALRPAGGMTFSTAVFCAGAALSALVLL